MSRKLFVLIVAANLLLISGSYAEQEPNVNPSADLSELSIEELMAIKVETVSTASKYEQKATEAPSSVSVVTSEEIRKYGYRNMAEILRSIRGFQMTNDRNYNYLNARGFGLPGDYNSRILLLVDGHRTNDNIYDMALLGREFPLEIDLIDRIEVVRGPSSSLYGTSAFFAVINVITKRGGDLDGLEISGEAGSFNSYKERLSYGIKSGSGVEMLFSGSYFNSEGDSRLFFSEFDDSSTNDGTAEDLDYERYRNFFAEMSFRDITLQGNYHQRKKGVPTASYETLFNDGGFFTVDEALWLGLKYEHEYSGGLTVSALINYNYSYSHGDYPYEGDTDLGEAEVVINRDSGKGKWMDGELQLIKSFRDKHKLTLGAHYQDNFRQKQKTYYIGADWGELDDDHDSANWALYVQDEFQIDSGMVLNAGLRYDRYDTFGDTVNPRAALIYSLSDRTTFKLVYGRAFRAPNAYELYYHDGYNTQKPGMDLSPEIINTYEVIYEQYLGKNLFGTIVGFIYKIDDLITLQTDPADGLMVFRNIDEVKASGVELEIKGKWKSGLEGRASYSFQHTENQQTNDTLPNSAKHLAKLNVSVPLIRDKTFLGIEEQYTNKRKNLSGDYSGSFFITNLTLFSKNVLKGAEFSLSAYNLFDESYTDPASEEHVQDSIEQDGRTFRAKLTYKF